MDATDRLRDRRIGLWTGTLDGLPLGDLVDTVAELDGLGYGSLWFGEAYGRESLTQDLVVGRSRPRTSGRTPSCPPSCWPPSGRRCSASHVTGQPAPTPTS